MQYLKIIERRFIFIGKTMSALLAGFFLLVLFSGCFSPWTGNGTLTINLGGQASRMLVERDEVPDFEYEILLEGPGGTINKTVKGGRTIAIDLAAGTWDLTLRAIGKTPDGYNDEWVDEGDEEGDGYFIHGNTFPDKMLRALGWSTVEIKAGQKKTANIDMQAATEVRNEDQLRRALQAANIYNKEYMETLGDAEIDGASEEIIVIASDITIEGEVTIQISGNITFIAEKPVTITRGAAGTMFEINYCTINLGKQGMKGTLTIDGNGDYSDFKWSIGPILKIHGAETILILNEGVALTNNYNNEIGIPGGGAVLVTNGSTFIMNGGEISGNNVIWTGGGNGGAVCVQYISYWDPPGASFVMNGGEIKGNSADVNGGGVYLQEDCTFTMNGGEISGNETKLFGGGVFIESGGNIDKRGGTIYGIDDPENANYSYDESYGNAVYVDNTPARLRSDTSWPGEILYSMYIGSVYSESDNWE